MSDPVDTPFLSPETAPPVAPAAPVPDERSSIVRANGIDLCYQTFGDRSKPALLLVMGLGTQMLGWDEDFCERLADHGFFVIRFDNRDIGRSTWFDHEPCRTRCCCSRRPPSASSRRWPTR